MPFTLRDRKPDHACLKPASESKKIDYPKPDNVLTFDRLSSVFLSNTNHEEDQPLSVTALLAFMKSLQTVMSLGSK